MVLKNCHILFKKKKKNSVQQFFVVLFLLFLNTDQKDLFNIRNITVFPAVRSHLDKSLQPLNLLATSVVVLIVSEQGNYCCIVNQTRERVKQSRLSLAGL